jgi:hypothetical protein
MELLTRAAGCGLYPELSRRELQQQDAQQT